jgi:hypothetical protein
MDDVCTFDVLCVDIANRWMQHCQEYLLPCNHSVSEYGLGLGVISAR